MGSVSTQGLSSLVTSDGSTSHQSTRLWSTSHRARFHMSSSHCLTSHWSRFHRSSSHWSTSHRSNSHCSTSHQSSSSSSSSTQSVNDYGRYKRLKQTPQVVEVPTVLQPAETDYITLNLRPENVVQPAKDSGYNSESADWVIL